MTLEVDGETFSQELEVLKDPHSEGSEADIAAQVAMLEELRVDLDTAAGLINRLEWIRRQLHDLEDRVRPSTWTWRSSTGSCANAASAG